MTRAMAVVAVLAMTTPAGADERDAWQATFAGSVTVAIGGVIMWVHGTSKMDDAHDALCDGGAYPECKPQNTTLTAVDVDRLNAKGEHGETIANIGTGVAIAGVALAAVSGYMGFVRPRQERAVVVAPTVTPTSAGAMLQLRW